MDAPSSVVSVVIPCFDAGAHLIEAVDSALAQTLLELEVIVVDDGSTDPETLLALEEVERRDRVAVLRQENAGVASARNRGLEAARGAYFFALDADDRIEPPYLAEAVGALESDPSLGIVYCRGRLFGDEEGSWVLGDFAPESMLIHNVIPASSVYRLADARQVGGYDTGMKHGREDHDFNLRILGLGRSVLRLEGEYFWYRRHGLTRNTVIGLDRDKWAQTYARMFRNNLEFYAEHAEPLFRDYIRQHDELRDLRFRYAAFERFRARHRLVYRALSRASRTIIGLVGGIAGASRRLVHSLRQLKHRLWVARHRFEQSPRTPLNRFYRWLDARSPYRFRRGRYGESFLDLDGESSDASAAVPRRVLAFWTGTNAMSPARAQAFDGLRSGAIGVPVELITPERLAEIEVPDHPFHPAYEHLSLVHRSDYLRAYAMQHHGGGYCDVKLVERSWLPAFERIDADADSWMIGYPEVSARHVAGLPGRLGRHLRRHFASLPGMGAYILRPGTPLTAEWLAEVERRLDRYAAALAQHPGDAYGRNPGYPIGWTELLGEVLQPLALKHNRHIRLDGRIAPVMSDYR